MDHTGPRALGGGPRDRTVEGIVDLVGGRATPVAGQPASSSSRDDLLSVDIEKAEGMRVEHHYPGSMASPPGPGPDDPAEPHRRGMSDGQPAPR